MTFFVDANVIVHSAVPSEYQGPCLSILDAILRRTAEGRTSTAALEEVWFIELSGRAGRLDGLTRHAYTLFSPLLPVTDEAFRAALSVTASQLGANDRLHTGTCIVNGIDIIVSADTGFDSVREIRRVDPLDGQAVRGLLG